MITNKFIKEWNHWNTQQRGQFLANVTLSLFVTGIMIPIIFGILAVVFDSYKITAFGAAAGLSIECMAINLLIWKKIIENL